MDLQRQQLVLQQEIRLLEQQKDSITRDLEQIEASKKAEYTQYTQEIRDLQKRRNDLMEQVEKLKEAMSLITQTYTEAKQSLEDYRKEQLKDVEIIVANAKENARVMMIAANKEAIRLSEEKADLIAREQSYESKLKELQQNNEKHNEEKEILRRSALAFLNGKQNREDLLADLDIKITTANHLLEKAQQMTKTLNERIAIDLQQIEIKWEDIRTKEREIDRENTASKQRASMLDKRKEDIQNEERAIKDKRETLERAIVEMRGKGVKI